MKKRLSILFLIYFIDLAVFAQSPPYIPYQAIARDASGQVKINASVQVEFKIFNSMVATSSAYEEVHSIITNDFGYFNLRIGGGNVQSGSFSAISWQSGNVSYEVWVDMGLGYTLLGGRTGFLSVPYALYAGNSNPNPTITINAPNSIFNPSTAVYDITVPSPSLSLNNNTLSIVNGNSVVLPPSVSSSYSAGNGITITGSVIANASPDQTVNITGAGVSGSYPNFTLASTPQTSLFAGNSNISISGAAPGYSISSSPTLSIAGDQLSVSNGNTVTLPSSSISITAGSNIAVAGSSPNFTISALEPTLGVAGNATLIGVYPNRIINVGTQSLSLSGNTLSLSAGGGSVNLPSTPSTTITQGSNVTVSGSAPSFTVNAITPTLTGSGNASMSGAYPNQTITVNPQTLSLNGSSLSLSNGGGSINLPSTPSTTITQGSNVTVSGSAPSFTVNAITPTLTGSGNASMSGSYPNQTITVNPQILSLSGNSLSLSNGGGSVALNGWASGGNSGMALPGNFIGTTDNVGLAVRTNNTERLRVTSTGSIGIGTTSPAAGFDINSGNVKLGSGSDAFSIVKFGSLSTLVLLSLGNNANTISIPGAQAGDVVVVTLNNHTAGAGSISLNNAYISANNTLSYNVNTSLGLLVTLNFSYILMRP